MRLTVIGAALLLTACGATSITPNTQAVRDYVTVEGLERVASVRMYRQLRYGYVNDYFVIVATGNRHYLVEFRARCRALTAKVFTAAMVDHRYDASYLRVDDTIRGCQVGKIYKATDEQLIEVKGLGKPQTPGDAELIEEETPPIEDIGPSG
jgi:hypothetical protein